MPLRFLDRHGEEAVAGACMLVLSALLFLQVIMRYVFRAPLSWSDEIASYCMVGLVQLGAAFAIRERAHIRVLAVFWLLPERWALGLAVVADLIWLAFILFMIWQGAVMIASLGRYPYLSAALQIDLKWMYLMIPIGFCLMLVRLLQVHWLWWRGGPAPIDFSIRAE